MSCVRLPSIPKQIFFFFRKTDMEPTNPNEEPTQNVEQENNDNDLQGEEPGNKMVFYQRMWPYITLFSAEIDLDDMPIEFRDFLQQLRLNPIGQGLFGNQSSDEGSDSESEEDPITKVDYTKLSTITFIETTLATRYSVRTSHQHYQLLNLCELTGGNLKNSVIAKYYIITHNYNLF